MWVRSKVFNQFLRPLSYLNILVYVLLLSYCTVSPSDRCRAAGMRRGQNRKPKSRGHEGQRRWACCSDPALLHMKYVKRCPHLEREMLSGVVLGVSEKWSAVYVEGKWYYWSCCCGIFKDCIMLFIVCVCAYSPVWCSLDLDVYFNTMWSAVVSP